MNIVPSVKRERAAPDGTPGKTPRIKIYSQLRNLCGTPDIFPFQALYPLTPQHQLDRDVSMWEDMGLNVAVLRLRVGLGPQSYETIPFNFSTIRRKVQVKQTSTSAGAQQETLEEAVKVLSEELGAEEDKLMLPGMSALARRFREEIKPGCEQDHRFLFCIAATPPFVRARGDMLDANYRIGGLMFYESNETILDAFPLVPIKQDGPVVSDDTKLKVRTFRHTAITKLLNNDV